MNFPIGVFDSGIGGLSILAELKALLPHEDFIYYADTKNHPYGQKSIEEIITCAKSCVEELLKKNCKLIVVACNTASLNAVDQLRVMYPDVLFVATYPAVKVAIDVYDTNSCLLMATPASIKSEKLHQFVSSLDKKEAIHFLPCRKLANLIEKGDEVDSYLQELLTPWVGKVDCVVLGCTHYPLIKNRIKKIIDVPIIDGSMGIGKRVEFLLNENHLNNQKNHQGKISFLSSSIEGEDEKTKNKFLAYDSSVRFNIK